MVAVADYQAVPPLVRLGRQLGYALVGLRLQCGGQHPAGTLTDDLFDQGAGLRRTVGIHYAEHGRAFPTRAATRAYSVTIKGPFGKVRPPRATPKPIHRS